MNADSPKSVASGTIVPDHGKTTQSSLNGPRESHSATRDKPDAGVPVANDECLPSDAVDESGGGSGREEYENPDRPRGLRFVILYACILFGDGLVGYDTSCVTTLAPVISDEFGAVDDVGWYGIAYLLALASSVHAFGQLYSILPMKAIFLASFAAFAVGSALSAAAPTSTAFIIGRAVSGLGSAGIFAGGSIIVANVTSLKDRPIYQGISGGTECAALALGPLIAGAIAHSSSWRASFYVIVVIAICNVVGFWMLVPRLPAPRSSALATQNQWQQLDWLGILCFTPMNICLILCLQWGGTVYEWQSGRIVALLVLACLFASAFGVAEYRKGDKAMLPLHLLNQRSVSIGALSQFGMSAALFVFGFYLPIYFQVVRGASTLESGLMYLPTALPFAIAIFGAGNITAYLGYYTPMMVIGTVLLSSGAGLMTLFTVATPTVQLVCFQILFGLGAGLAFQQTYLSVQVILPEKHVATAIVCLSFAQELDGIVALAVSQNFFLNSLISRLSKIVPGLDRQTILGQGITSLPSLLPARYRDAILEAYAMSVIDVFSIGLGCACLTVCSLAIEWRSVHDDKHAVTPLRGHEEGEVQIEAS